MCTFFPRAIVWIICIAHLMFFFFHFMEVFGWFGEKTPKEKADILIRWLKWPIYIVYETIRDGYKSQ